MLFLHSKKLLLTLTVLFAFCSVAAAMDTVTLRRGGKEFPVVGRILLEALDGGILLQARDGTLWTIKPGEVVSKSSDDAPFKPFTREEYSDFVLKQLPEGFTVHVTAHYLIFHNTSRNYAHWCGSLFERLYGGFSNYWKQKGLRLSEPEFPLAAVVFKDRRSYTDYAQAELGDAVSAVVGFYSLRTNRMTMFDLSGTGQFAGDRGAREAINRILSQPNAFKTVSTIVHEATHQIAFNRGMHQRYADCPLWFVEGLAVFFETPDLKSKRGWRNIGGVNRMRLRDFAKYAGSRPADSLQTLIQSDDRCRTPSTGIAAYAEAWALTYYLIQRRSKDYIAYAKMLAEKKPMRFDNEETRVKEFEKHFGDLEDVEKDFMRYMRRMR